MMHKHLFYLIEVHNKGLQKFVSICVLAFGQLLDIILYLGVYEWVYICRRGFLMLEPLPAAIFYWISISYSRKWICCKNPEMGADLILISKSKDLVQSQHVFGVPQVRIRQPCLAYIHFLQAYLLQQAVVKYVWMGHIDGISLVLVFL